MEEKSIAHMVDQLFQTHRHPSGREYTYQEVADGAQGGLEPSYISKLRKGKIPNPGRNTLLLLCKFFQVAASYFFPELEQAEDKERQSLPVDHVLAHRAAKLSPEAQRQLAAFLDVLQKNNPDATE